MHIHSTWEDIMTRSPMLDKCTQDNLNMENSNGASIRKQIKNYTSKVGNTNGSALCAKPVSISLGCTFCSDSSAWKPVRGSPSAFSQFKLGPNFANSRSWLSICSLYCPHAALRFWFNNNIQNQVKIESTDNFILIFYIPDNLKYKKNKSRTFTLEA